MRSGCSGGRRAAAAASRQLQEPELQLQASAQMPFNASQQDPVTKGYPSAPVVADHTSTPVQLTQPTAQQTSGAMTLDEAKSVVVDFGKYRGSTLGQIAMVNPGDLQWYAERYVGSNKALKEGAALLVNAAREMAG